MPRELPLRVKRFPRTTRSARIALLTIVAAFPLRLFAATTATSTSFVVEDATLSPATIETARDFGLEPAKNRGRFMVEITRILFDRPTTRIALPLLPVAAASPTARADTTEAIVVPVPLPASVWSRAIFKRAIGADDLVDAILKDRTAALLCHGLAGMDDETLAFFAEQPLLLSWIAERHAWVVAAFGASLRVEGGRVRTPGGDAFTSAWETVVGESVQQPERFLRALLAHGYGRLAYLYDLVGQLDSAHAKFVLGSWIPEGTRLERFRALADTFVGAQREWRLDAAPFTRPLHDAGMLLTRLAVEESGRPASPAGRLFWGRVFDGGSLTGVTPDTDMVFDAAWIVDAGANGDIFERADRIDQVSYAQRLFGRAPSSTWPDVLAVLRALPAHRTLLLVLERMGIQSPGVLAAVARKARELPTAGSGSGYWAHAQFQGALAIVDRMAQVGSIDATTAERLVSSLSAVPTASGGRYDGQMVEWLRSELVPRLPQGPDLESRLIAGLSGPPADPSTPPVEWEGQQYRIDFADAESRRLRLVREKQGSLSLDAALALGDVVRTLGRPGASTRDFQTAAATLGSWSSPFAPRSDRGVSSAALGSRSPRATGQSVDRLADEVLRLASTRDRTRYDRLAAPAAELVDAAIGETLMSFAYAADLGDPEGAAFLGRNVALRHDFALGQRAIGSRSRSPWSIPRPGVMPGVPWHIEGSLLGLDIALARHTLRRTNLDSLPGAPSLTSNERDSFALSVALLNPRRLRDTERDAIAESMARGRARVAALATGPEAADRLSDDLGLDGWRRRSLRWTLAEEPDRFASMFSLTELLRIGGGLTPALEPWGMSALGTLGCVCLRLDQAPNWRLFAGRTQLGLLASVTADLHLHVATVLHDLGIPAALAKVVLGGAVQDFVDEVQPTDPSDWWSLVEAAGRVPRERMEDYVAAAAAVDGPLVPIVEPAGQDDAQSGDGR
jgi:hypothetical protein